MGSYATAVVFSPTEENQYILAGYSCGSLALYNKTISVPLSTWLHASEGVVKAGFDPVGKGGFYVLDAKQQLHIWDLAKSESAPLITVPLGTGTWTCADWVLPESSK